MSGIRLITNQTLQKKEDVMKKLIAWLLFIGSMVNAIFVLAGLPFLAHQYVVEALNNSTVILVIFIIGVIIWVFSRGYWEMGKISEAYQKLRGRKS